MTRLDVLRLWVRHRYSHPEGTAEEVRRMSIMGIPWYEVGTAGMERTGVSFHNLAPASSDGDSNIQIALTHPSIAGTGLTDHQTEQLLHHPQSQPQTKQQQQNFFYPHARRIILTHEKPREPLLRPDELVVKEGVRRRLGMHRKWAMMMLYGFCDEGGWNLPVWREEELLRMGRGLPPRPPKVVLREDGGGVEEGKGKGKEKDSGGEKGEDEPGSATWTTLPSKGSS